MSEVSEIYTNMSAGDDVDEFISIPTLGTETQLTIDIVKILFISFLSTQKYYVYFFFCRKVYN